MADAALKLLGKGTKFRDDGAWTFEVSAKAEIDKRGDRICSGRLRMYERRCAHRSAGTAAWA
jgi:hypothetical protein